MSLTPLIACSLLDPRPAEEAAAAPIVDAVNIPLAELPRRTHELPPRNEVIPVAGPVELAQLAVAWLTGNDRQAIAQREYAHADVSAGVPRGRLWRPNAFLEEVVAGLAPGCALELACGMGRDAVFLASRGWDVTAVDVLPDALDRARDLATRYVPERRSINWVAADLERDPLDFGRRFDLIAGFRYLHRPLFACLAGWLNRGGSVVYETFTTLHRQQYGKPAAIARTLRPGELRDLLHAFAMRHYSEAWHGTAHTARAWAMNV